MSSKLWRDYLGATRERGARPLVERALERVPNAGRALDLGCGAGGDTLALLAHGLHVCAIDGLPEAVDAVRARAARAGLNARLDVRLGKFEEFELERDAFDVVVASFALPFCAPSRFEALFAGIRAALVPGGLLVGQLFGERDQWARDPEHPARIFLSRGEVERYLDGLERLHFEEEEERRPTALGGDKDWHLFHFIVRRPGTLPGPALESAQF